MNARPQPNHVVALELFSVPESFAICYIPSNPRLTVDHTFLLYIPLDRHGLQFVRLMLYRVAQAAERSQCRV